MATREVVSKTMAFQSMCESDKLAELALFESACGADQVQQLADEEKQLMNLNIESTNAKNRRRLKKLDEQSQRTELLQTQWGDDTPDTTFKLHMDGQVSEKRKTRPQEPVDAEQGPEINAPQTPATPALPLIPVKLNSLAVFMKMFPAGDAAEDFGGKTRWQDLVIAMADAGFPASSGSGSEVSFHDTRQGEGGHIVFHCPHPDPEVTDIKLRSLGKRMSKWFKWERESFVEREKGEAVERERGEAGAALD